ncbi:hypothetical protein, partial [Pseudomonas sp. BMS12]|uniref:hypothetical protein n=1 Tax=Pseudomonas sp. BMS12 TaxID=1796033 RepID=UPI00191C5DD9
MTLAGYFFALCLPSWAVAQEIVIDSNLTLPRDSQQYAGDDVIVEGATLTLYGATRFGSLTLRTGARVISPTGYSLSISADSIRIDASSRIDVSAKGNVANTGLNTNYYSGGSYGGRGGGYSTGSTNYYSLASYGDYRLPRDLGTGGRNSSSSVTRGGGALELIADSLSLDGLILADGQTIAGSSYGSGSGGSVLLQVGSLGLGEQARIQADGGGSTSAQT